MSSVVLTNRVMPLGCNGHPATAIWVKGRISRRRGLGPRAQTAGSQRNDGTLRYQRCFTTSRRVIQAITMAKVFALAQRLNNRYQRTPRRFRPPGWLLRAFIWTRVFLHNTWANERYSRTMWSLPVGGTLWREGLLYPCSESPVVILHWDARGASVREFPPISEQPLVRPTRLLGGHGSIVVTSNVSQTKHRIA